MITAVPASLAASGINPTFDDWRLPLLALLFSPGHVCNLAADLLLGGGKSVTADIRDYVRKHGDRESNRRP